MNNLFRGKLCSLDEFKLEFNQVKKIVLPPLNTEILFNVLGSISEEIQKKSDFYRSLFSDLTTKGQLSVEDAESSINYLLSFIKIDNLRLKLKRELGTEYPFELKRIDYKEKNFEAFYPLGNLIHITPNNAPLLSTLAMLEGLLSGNINWLKLGRNDSNFSVLFYAELLKHDSTDILKEYIFIARLSSKDQTFFKRFVAMADGVSAWGGEEGISKIQNIIPSGARFIAWGHRISFAYVSKKYLKSEMIEELFFNLAYEICQNDQLACSSPQVIFVEEASFYELNQFGEKLYRALEKVSPKYKKTPRDEEVSAELTITEEIVELESMISESKLLKNKEHGYRILINMREGLEPSPLYRSIWVRPISRASIYTNIVPMRQYLQTVGLASVGDEFSELAKILFSAGVSRIRPIGGMTDSYTGEPHDGESALARFMRKISYSDSGNLDRQLYLNLNDEIKILRKNKIMTKYDFQNTPVKEEYSELFFHSGGSSGEPKLSVFTYDDYHRQMEMAAAGLYAAGLDPVNDRVMNLFYAGNLYGGFTSFFTILECLKAKSFGMGASTDLKFVADNIVKNKVNTILGMPSYILQLFRENEKKLAEYKGIKKVFYGGEHLNKSQQAYLKNVFGVELIKSAAYGSVDAGPLAYQCLYSEGTVHHLQEGLHDLEVVSLDSDHTIAKGEVGRLLFSSKVRHGQKIERYEIGDVGRIIEGECRCGRLGLRFELLGRHGDIFRIGSIFFSYQKFQNIFSDLFNYEGHIEINLVPAEASKNEVLVLKVEKRKNFGDNLRESIISNYKELDEVVKLERVLDFEIKFVTEQEFNRNATTGKYKTVIDLRAL